MEALDLQDLIQGGESSTVQFKRTVTDAHAISQEIVAFANAKGGYIVIGVEDSTGDITGLTYREIQSVNNLLSNAATNNVIPQIKLFTETVGLQNGKKVVVVRIEEGDNKPYKDRNGAIWDKNGSDKRRVTSNEEIARLLQSSKYMYADEMQVKGSTVSDIDNELFNVFLKTKYRSSPDIPGIPVNILLQNLNLADDDTLTLAGLLLFSNRRQKYRPQFSVQCVSVGGTDITGNSFFDNEPAFEGALKNVFDQSIAFVERSIRKIPSGTSFNSLPVWEIPYEVFEELIVNALIHRDYFINSTVKVFIFSNRIEIVNPGVLPNSLTVANIMNGISIQRNPVLQSLGQYILPYKGIGTGISRALSNYAHIDFINNAKKNEFRAIIKRPS